MNAKATRAIREQNALTTDEHLTAAAQSEQRKQESWDRSETDGFLSQWASGITADLARTRAEIVANGGRSTFPALFDLSGNLVAAKLIDAVYGLTWALLSSDDPTSKFAGFVTAFPKRTSTIARKGYREGSVSAPAYADTEGSGTGLSGATSVGVVVRRADGGFSRNVEILSDGTDKS